jgi:ABC-2 type transport system ATP-binding protein
MILKDVVAEMIDRGKIVLFSSHQMNYTEEFCRDIAILNGGRIVLSGGIRDVKRDTTG